MSNRQHYFVVLGEIDSEGQVSFALDHATSEARFSEGPIWDMDINEWIRPGALVDADDNAILDDLVERLS